VLSILADHMQEWRCQSPYASDADWIFPSMKNKGRTPRQGGMIGTDHLRKAAIAAGVIKRGERLGMHSLRHSLATYLVSQGCDPKTVQGMLRLSNLHTTLQLYSHGRSQDRLDARPLCWTHFSRRRAPQFSSASPGLRVNHG
jgi:site-specific recombinase XerD